MAKCVLYQGAIHRVSNEAAALLVSKGGQYVSKAEYRRQQWAEREQYAADLLLATPQKPRRKRLVGSGV